MSEIYTVIVVILGILAVSGLFVGVSNDAVNFLNSAIGSKAAPMKTILLVASIGILLGTVTSSGMMEVGPQRYVQPGAFLLPRSDDALYGRDVRQRHPAGPLQLDGTPDFDDRIADLLPVGCRRRRFDLQDLQRRGPRHGRPEPFHQHGPRDGYRFGDSALRSDRFHVRHPNHVYLPSDLLVPLYGDVPPLRCLLVRSLLHGDPLLRRLQRTQNPARRKRRDRMDRPAYPALPLLCWPSAACCSSSCNG